MRRMPWVEFGGGKTGPTVGESMPRDCRPRRNERRGRLDFRGGSKMVTEQPPLATSWGGLICRSSLVMRPVSGFDPSGVWRMSDSRLRHTGPP